MQHASSRAVAGTLSRRRHDRMTDAHDRSARVLDPAYLADLDVALGRRPAARCTPSASSSRPRCRTCAGSPRPASTSSRPRSSGARAAGRSKTSSSALPADPRRPRPAGRTRRRATCPCRWRPTQDSEWAPELERVRRRARQPARPSPTTELDEAIAGLRSLERDVSDRAPRAVRGDRPHRPPPRRAAALTTQ